MLEHALNSRLSARLPIQKAGGGHFYTTPFKQYTFSNKKADFLPEPQLYSITLKPGAAITDWREFLVLLLKIMT